MGLKKKWERNSIPHFNGATPQNRSILFGLGKTGVLVKMQRIPGQAFAGTTKNQLAMNNTTPEPDLILSEEEWLRGGSQMGAQFVPTFSINEIKQDPEPLTEKKPCDKAHIIDQINAVASLLGRETLFRGNCGTFAIALAKWISESTDAIPSIVGITLAYPEDAKPMNLDSLGGRDMNHVFVCVEIDGVECLFDGEGLVNEAGLKGWEKQTWFDCGPGHDREKWLAENDEVPVGVCLVFGDTSDRSIGIIENATAHNESWESMFEAFQKVNSPSFSRPRKFSL